MKHDTALPAPFHAALADGPPGATCVWLQAGSARIRVAWWKAGDKGTVLLLPGRTECVEKYGRAAGDLVARGYSVITIDWRGQGLADRALADRREGHVGDFAEYQQDLDAMLAEAGRAGLPQPFYMIAHSMGGCIGLRGLMRGLPVRAAAFSAPMWGIAMAAWLRPVASVVSALAGPLGLMARYAPSTSAETYLLQAPFAGNVLTTDREMWDYMRRQVAEVPDLALGGPSIGWLKAALRECAALAVMPAPKVPAICALGTVEKVVDVPPVHLRMAGWANGQLDLYPGAEHEIMMEGPAVRQRFFDRAAALFEANR
ncbi:alpha/beta hydrolase [Tabrizicola sp.]|uniref:alpha/beta fold hydrolase n=1 Tax=Tabrizicola sp. TaxID=2005166 RepID=UPI001A5B6788|nr:alpha/beta hydrolase [Tabrizicola sp.]MBL9064124.1 alpha/beta hydrolase [Tabrizicola sp.]